MHEIALMLTLAKTYRLQGGVRQLQLGTSIPALVKLFHTKFYKILRKHYVAWFI
jgi:hypothetical protein